VDDFVENLSGRQCYTVFDLFWGFDARKIHPQSRDLTAFMTPLSRTVPPCDSGTHHPPSGTHKLSRHYRNASRDLRDVGTPSEELTHSLCFGTRSRRGRLPVPLRFYFGRHLMPISVCDILPYDLHSLSLRTCSI